MNEAVEPVDGSVATGKRSARGSGSSWATSWKLWTVLLLLGLLLIAVTTLLPAIRRYQAFQFFDQNNILYELTDQNEWITDMFGDHAQGFREIQAIEMEGSITDEALFHIGRFRETKFLIWRQTGRTTEISDLGISALQQLRELEGVQLSWVELNDDMLGRWLAETQLLRIVRIDGTDIGRNTLESISRIPTLQVLDISRCTLDDSDFASLEPMQKLQELHLPGTGAGDEAAKWISQSHQLTELNFASNSITDEGLKQFATLSNLESLMLLMCPNLSDEGVSHLDKLTRLQTLGLPSKAINQESIEVLRRLPMLREVHISGSITNFQLRTQMIEQWDYSDHLTHFELR